MYAHEYGPIKFSHYMALVYYKLSHQYCIVDSI